MNKVQEIKVIRLVTGEDIIANCIFDDETQLVLLDNPMKVGMNRPNQTKLSIMFLSPWLPIELLENDSCHINQNDIITILNPKKSMVEYYLNLIEELNSEPTEEEYKEETVDEEDLNLEDVLFNIKEHKKNIYH